MSETPLLDDPRPAAQRARAPRAFVKSFGCQMNVYDSQRMADLAAVEGYGEAATAEDADLIVLNTCHIRERASEKIYSELGKLRELKDKRGKVGRRTTIVVAGCVAQAEGAEILRRQPAVDIVVGPQSYHRLPQLLRAAEARSGVVDTDFPAEDKFAHLPPSAPAAVARRGVAAFVTVQEGCDKFCSFCVVPYTRGAEASRPVESIVAEIGRLTKAGVREVVLIGQNVNAYHGLDAAEERVGLAALIARAAAVPGVRRVRYATSHPNDMTDDLIAAHASVEALAPYLHLPVQSGSDRILLSMNRRHLASDYLAIVDRVRQARPDIALSSDFIVGYPGESDADFAATLALVRAVGFASSYAFKFSARPGTPAAEMAGQVDDTVKAERLAELQALLEHQKQTFNRACVGRRLEVLFEKPGRHDGQAIGRSPYQQAVFAEAPLSLTGAVAQVEIVDVRPNSLHGRVVSPASQEQDLISRAG
ncbi:tRNA-i(6)A37 thiotransferase enzyme MiaB [Roseiarcus fermentans]|uniref:tRNA-2-methylthio-N(6)-dimethylallyladenosine synthase n=1 Tax=Roseiarcus fermentans TaxID=1473586 RepID=A0A366EMH8_9HYPH|nr:tRNA-i(6)A37 thiotransferase enzyme MiaB [Roseiarcus fermentans]